MKIGIITDIHEDAERLSLAIKSLEKHNCEFLVCLGDIAGFDERFYSYKYSKNLEYCSDCIKVNCRVIIPGNHDLFHMKMLPKYKTAFDFPENWYELTFAKRKSLSNGIIWTYENDSPVEDAKSFYDLLSDKPDMKIYDTATDRILFSHSIFPDLSGFFAKKPTKIKDFESHFNLSDEKKYSIGISGHLHPNGLLRINRKKVNKSRFVTMEIPYNEPVQYICPAIADGVQDNGFTILDTIARTIESIPLRTPRHNSIIL